MIHIIATLGSSELLFEEEGLSSFLVTLKIFALSNFNRGIIYRDQVEGE